MHGAENTKKKRKLTAWYKIFLLIKKWTVVMKHEGTLSPSLNSG